MRKYLSVLYILILVLSLSNTMPVAAQVQPPPPQRDSENEREIHHDTSAPLRSMPAAPATTSHFADPPQLNYTMPTNTVDPVIQRAAGPLVATTAGLNFAGVGSGDYGFAVNSAPPDTNGAVGDTQYVQWVNSSFAVFNKTTGALVLGPVTGNTIWSGFGGACQTNNDGDPIVQFDKAAHRWILTQFSVSTTPYTQCVAVSTTPDATGSYNRYSFAYGTQFPDYPKLGVWPDGYYISYNIFSNGTTFVGSKVCAFDRTSMLAGAAATQQCFQLGSAFGGLLPADLDGSTPPPAGAPNMFIAFGSNSASLDTWKFHVDWTTPANSTFTGPTNIPAPAFVAACIGGGTCIPQAGTTQQLDSLADRLMYRLAYRNFGDHEALVLNHSVTAGSSVGVRWYELRNISATPTVFQSGTYAPDATFRWMGSIAMDKSGNIALGYSASSSSLNPAIRYTGRAPSDALGTLQAETSLQVGGGSQTGNLTRWGDYSALTIDPTDDCTFFYTNEYEKVSGSFNWSTRIASFKFPSCGAITSNDFSIAASPASVSIAHGSSGTSTISTAVLSGVAETVSLSASVSPAGPTVSISPNAVTSGGSAALSISVGASVAPGPYTVTVTGTAPSATHSATLALTVTAPVANDFSISASPASLSIVQGNSGTPTISTAVLSGSAETVSLSASVSPAGPVVSISPSAVTAGVSAALSINVGASVAPGSYTVTVAGTAPSATHSATLALTVTAPVANDFSISASPASLSIVQARSATSTISTAVTSGSAATISLSASVSPAGASVALSPASVTAGGSSTLTISVGTSVATGVYTVTVTGTEGSAVHSTAVSVTVTAPSGNAILNGGFETGSLMNWTVSGTAGVVSSGAHSGTYAARMGSTSPTSTSSIKQTFTAPSGSTALTFWYNMTCPDTVTYDWATATLRDNTTGSTRTVLPRTCTLGAGWKQVSASLTAGHSYTLTLTNRDDLYPSDPSYTLYDDVVVK